MIAIGCGMDARWREVLVVEKLTALSLGGSFVDARQMRFRKAKQAGIAGGDLFNNLRGVGLPARLESC